MNKTLRLIIVATLVFAMVLSMVGCGSDVLKQEEVETVASAPSVEVEAPTVAQTATAEEAQTTTADAVTTSQIVDLSEAQLELYGITFPEFDLEYTSDITEMADLMSFGVDIDSGNIYQEAYEFTIDAKVTAVSHEGSSISTSKFAANTAYVSAGLADGYYDYKDFSEWTNEYILTYEGTVANCYFTVSRAGIYTVEYTIEVEHDKNNEYGYYTPGEVDEKYTVTKTYTVEKAELELKTSSDAFQVDDDIFFVDSTISLSDDEKAAFADYDTKIDVTSCDGTVVGEYKLSITVVDSKDNVVDVNDIVLDNYYVTLNEGTRYILSAADVAKANVMRKMAYDDATSTIDLTTEYSQETIDYYYTLTAGQKVLAAVKTDNKEWSRISEYLVVSIPVSSSSIKEAEYNMERADLIAEIEGYIKSYMTASTSRLKEEALTKLAVSLQQMDNESHEYGSDLLYALGEIATGYYDEGEFVEFDTEEGFDKDDTDSTYAIFMEDASSASILIFQSVYDEEEETYAVDFGYHYDGEESDYVVNAIYDEYWYTFLARLDSYDAEMEAYAELTQITQGDIDDIEDARDDLVSAYSNLLDYQKDFGGQDMEDMINYYDTVAQNIIDRWNAYINLIDVFEFNQTYIDNAKQDELTATYLAIVNYLGYTFENYDLAADVLGSDEIALSQVLFAAGDYAYATPTLFVDGAIEAAQALVQLMVDLQDETEAVKTDLINYLVSTGEYEFVNADDYVTQSYVDELEADALAGDFDADSIDDAATLADIEAYIDYAVLTQAFDYDSKFYSNYEKYDMETAISKLFEDIIEAAQDRIDELADLADVEIVLVGTVDRNGSSPSAIVISGGDYTYTLSGTEEVVKTSNEDEITVGASQYIKANGGVLSDGDTFVITRNVTFTGAYVALGTVEMQITVTVKNSTIE